MSRAAKGSTLSFGGACGALSFGGACGGTSEGLFLSTVRPLALPLAVETGVMFLEAGLAPPPSRTKASTAPDRLLFISPRTYEFCSASWKPISRRAAILALKVSSCALPTLEPKTREALFIRGGDSLPSDPLRGGDIGGEYLSMRGRENVAEVDRKAKPNFFAGLGGRGGGWSSAELMLVLPVLCIVARRAVPETNSLNSYLRRMKRSMTPPASSASIGMSGLIFPGLYFLFDRVLPTFFMF